MKSIIYFVTIILFTLTLEAASEQVPTPPGGAENAAVFYARAFDLLPARGGARRNDSVDLWLVPFGDPW